MAKSNEEYWRDRALELEEKWHTKSKETIERKLAAYYQQSLQHIQRDIEALYGSFSKDNQLSMTDARKLLQGNEFRVWRMDIKEYLAQIDATGDPALLKELNTLAMRSRITRLDKLYSETLMELSKLAEKTGLSMDKFLTEAYKDGYYRNLFEIGKKAGLVSTPVKVDNKQAENVLRTPWSGKNYSERIWRNDARLAETIKETVTQGIHRGSSLQKLSKQVADKMNVGINDAKRLVQTELNYVQNKSALDSIKEAGMGFYRIISTHDARTCQRCGDKDGEEVAVGDASPGDTLPPFHARCRCTIAASFGDGKTQKGKRIARDENGRNIRISADMKYGDWKAVYIEKTRTIESWEEEHAKKVAANAKNLVQGAGNSGIIVANSNRNISTTTRTDENIRQEYELINNDLRLAEAEHKKAIDIAQKAESKWDTLTSEERIAINTRIDDAISKVNEIKHSKTLDALRIECANRKIVLTSELANAYDKADIAIISDIVKKSSSKMRKVWNLAEGDIKVLDKQWDKTSHYDPNKKGIKLNILKDKIPDYGHLQYETTFHEIGHLIDHFIGGHTEVSVTFKNGLFGKTLREEIEEHINNKLLQLKKEAMSKGVSPKNIKIKDAYNEISKDLLSLKSTQGADVSDIFSGGTLNKVKGHASHSTSYWKDSENNLYHETFAHMFSSTMMNPQSLEQIKIYFPKSYKVFEDMIDDFLKKKGV